MATEEGWHLDKRVPVSIIVVLFAQLAGGIWMFATMNSQIQKNTADIARVERSVDLITSTSQTQAIQLGRIEEQVAGLRADIQRLLRVLDNGRP
jgi:Tfp pilus assembly protein PilO